MATILDPRPGAEIAPWTLLMAGRRFEIAPAHSRPAENGGRVYVAMATSSQEAITYFVQQLILANRLVLRQAGRPELTTAPKRTWMPGCA